MLIFLKVIYWGLFILELLVLPAVLSDGCRREYGRIFGTRVDTDIYKKIFNTALVCVCIVFVLIMIVG